MLKFGGEKLIQALFWLFNRIYEQGESPKIWKKGEILPIPKVKDQIITVDKFRPICLLSAIGKVMEKIINNRLYNLAINNNCISRHQSGFIKQKSTMDNLIILQQEIHCSFRKGEYFVAVFLDIKKAYDSVNRELLLKVIRRKGVNGKIISYLTDFLGQDRVNVTKFRGTISAENLFRKGLPQGSPISPLLFNIYLNDITQIIEDKILMFADDIVIWDNGCNLENTIRNLNNRIRTISELLNYKELELSPTKCVPIIFTRKRRLNQLPTLTLGETNLEFKERAKYLGIIFDRSLTWKFQIKDIQEKCSKRLGVIRYLCKKYKIQQKDALTLYKTLLRPILEHASEIYGDTSKTNKNKLDAIEHKAICTALGVNILAKRSESNREARVMPLEIRRKRKIIALYKRRQGGDLRHYLETANNKILKGKYRKSFLERFNTVIAELNLEGDNIDKIGIEKLDEMFDKEWEQNIRNLRKPDKFYHKIDISKQYEQFCSERDTQKFWHQARLKVIPTK